MKLSQLRMELPPKPRRAADLGLTGAMALASALEACPDRMEELHGVSAAEAELTLRCYRLASRPYWGRDAMLDAACVAGGDDVMTRLFQRDRRELEVLLRDAAIAEGIPESLRPPEALAFLERCGVYVFGELREAVERFHPRQPVQPGQAPAAETAEERQARRLTEFRDAGGVVPKNGSGRWQGVGRVAGAMGITRQALTDDLKAALERERGQRRGGGALDPARLGWMTE